MVATKIRELCRERGMTVSELERKAGIANGVIRRWDELYPNARPLKAAADVLGVTVDELLRDDPEQEDA